MCINLILIKIVILYVIHVINDYIFRQSRNADKSYTEHFYHQNTIKDTHIDCDNDTYEKVKKRNQ